VNSEELELSLRAEFENYLKGIVAGMHQDVADFQKNFEAEFDKHRAQMDEAFRNFSARFESEIDFDQAFTESVVEHLRLARDDGAQVAAQAFGEAQKLEQAVATPHFDQLRDAINDISSQTTQSAILKTLVDHVAHYTPRGAFFIVKHESFICWRRFDRERLADDESVREIHFPVSADTLLADAVGALATRTNASQSHSEDDLYLDALSFGRPDQMFAIPLMARGRAVAVFYADSAGERDVVQLEAIESLVRVAGLTVELRAASITPVQAGAAEAPSYVPMQTGETFSKGEPETVEVESTESSSAEEPTESAPVYEEYTGEVAVEESEIESSDAGETEVDAIAADKVTYFEPAATEEAEVAAEFEPGYDEDDVDERPAAERVNDFAFAPSENYGVPVEAETEPEPTEDYAYTAEAKNGSNGHAFEAAPEPVVEVPTTHPVKSRFSERNVDLPIEVSDEERRLHNDARRFARLLVSEIKLYNEQKVNEGRNASDLYDRLREAIERSREMYDKRVQPQVAAKFDYFHYELVSNLAEGNDAKLGASYPGATV